MKLINEETYKKINLAEYDMEEMDYNSVKKVANNLMLNNPYIHSIEINLKRYTLHQHLKVHYCSKNFIEKYIEVLTDS